MLRLLLVVSFLSSWLVAQEVSDFRVSAIFGSHMVLPAAQEVPVHGSGPVGAEVLIAPSWGPEQRSKVRGDGRWQISIKTLARGQTGAMRISCGDAKVAIDDVLFGDVWLASGQSNMEMKLKGVVDAEQVAAKANWPELRVFTTNRQTAEEPAEDVQGEWVVCTPEVARSFTAVGYFFAQRLLANGKGPIGIVDSSWGGTRAEAWTTRRGLRTFDEFRDDLKALNLGAKDALLQARREQFFDAIEASVPNVNAVKVAVPEVWSKSELKGFDGAVDYERTVQLPAGFVGKSLVLELGAIDDMDTVFWNDKLVASSHVDGVWSTPRRYTIPAEHITGANAKLMVRVIDTGGEGGFTSPAAQMKLSVAGDASQSIGLAGEWVRRLRSGLAGLPKWPRTNSGANRPTVLWNGMVEPLLPFEFTGVIWYQGESNRDKAAQYASLFPAMIESWREAFGREVPFYFVQIAPFGYGKDSGQTAELREAQAAALRLPKTGMAVTLDCGNPRDIHPRNKKPVGERLADLALAQHYGHGGICSGPRAVTAAADGAAVRVRFADGHGALELAHGSAGFEIAGGDGRFVAANASVDGDELVLQNDAVKTPQAVRYAWRAAPKWSLQNAEGYPAAPFRLAIR